MARIRYLKTVGEVLKELGGNEAVADLTGHKPNAVAAWRYVLGQLPSKTYVVLQRKLKKRGCHAPPELWGMVEEKERV